MSLDLEMVNLVYDEVDAKLQNICRMNGDVLTICKKKDLPLDNPSGCSPNRLFPSRISSVRR